MDLLEQLRSALGSSYQIERELGGGGMSRVYLAEDTALKRRVVIKLLSPDLAVSVNHERFLREIRLAARLQHSNIVVVLSAGETGGLPYYVMPYVEGESLRARIERQGALPVDDVIAIVRDVAEALSYAHQHDVVHRDIKPDNILLGTHHALVTDFGVAKALSASSTASGSITSLGSTLGTPNYMAPEQAAADPRSDHRADLYSLGVVAYEALAGKSIFGQRSPQQMLYAHAVESPVPISKLRGDTPDALAELVMQLLDKNPANRPQTADELLQRLRSVNDRSALASSRFRRRVIPLGIAIAVLAVVVMAVLFGKRPAAPTTDRRSIAVLPFEETGASAGDVYFGDGISEQLIDALSKLGQLRVAGRTSSFAFRNQVGDVRGIGKTLGVGTILTGTVQRASKRIRVRAELTDVNNGFTLWSQSYDSELTDLLAVQDAISNAIVAALTVELGAGEAAALKSRQTSIDAYDQYLRGVHAWNQRGTGIVRSIAYFKQSIALDSLYAPAYAGLAQAYITAANWSLMTIGEIVPLVRANGARALAIDSLSVEGHQVMADLKCHHEYDFSGAIEEYRRAIALNPNYVTGHYQYAFCIAGLGRFDEATAEATTARELDPLNPQLLSAVGKIHYLRRQWQEGLAAYESAAKLPTDVASKYFWIGQYHRALGNNEAAIAAMNKGVAMSGDSPLYTAGMAMIFAAAGHQDSTRAILARIERLPNHPSYHIAATHAILRHDEMALEWLGRAYAERSDWLPMLRYDHVFDRIRETPRFKAIEKRLNIQ